MTSAEKLKAKIAALTNDQLLEIAARLSLDYTTDAIYVGVLVDGELEKRLTPGQFSDHIAAMEAMLDAAA